MKKSEVIVLILWVLGTFLLFLAMINSSNDNKISLCIILIITQVLIILMGLPVLVFAMYQSEWISTWFFWILTLLTVLNTAFLIITGWMLSEFMVQFFMVSTLELLPVIMLYQNKHKRIT